MDTYHDKPKKNKPPCALLIFFDGLEKSPLIVPSSESEEMDEKIMDWANQRLIAKVVVIVSKD